MDPAFTNFLVSTVQGMLVVILPIAVTTLTAWLVAKIKELRASLGVKTMTSIDFAVATAVNAAEQAGSAKLIEDKKAYALTVAQAYLDKQGIHADLALLEGLVESAVKTELKDPQAELSAKLIPATN